MLCVALGRSLKHQLFVLSLEWFMKKRWGVVSISPGDANIVHWDIINQRGYALINLILLDVATSVMCLCGHKVALLDCLCHSLWPKTFSLLKWFKIFQRSLILVEWLKSLQLNWKLKRLLFVIALHLESITWIIWFRMNNV